ncbi:MAG: DNA polymerase III subunit gamma/tau [Bacteroidales bacterium]|nr:DNA polymerase III subunit gamma/tau [Bacteroidales bacterium]HOL98598.1 DNA polymerase III subunit gamma/tau [Bacteroidales bacterium]HPD24406.1 DNA polymerase III subunit gamma/tau [Bacteroidales bacterium]HRT00294.1 DNA polymerase III subunit gamma/tau [Bacteroidales bacterium]HRT80518.1 DNA polymerase III subunit gamma/tau [Bacteroidales bacterium]
MENYIVSARKYRPDSFQMVVGQDAITKTLKNIIKLNQIGQAYLFCGPRGVGKTTCARIFAKTINCTNLSEDGEACNQCESCVSFNSQRSLNIHELDAASNNSVDDIRNLIDQVRIPPQIGKYSVYIIDEFHMLSSNAFNAFLKTLEEPPKHVVFILATTEKHKIIPTILSRCQIFDFNRISVEDIKKRLEFVAKNENIIAESDALHIIAQKADGAMRDALSIFDQIVSFTGGKITYDETIKNLNVLDYDTYFYITEALVNGDYVKSLQIFDNVIKRGFEASYFINGLASHFRDLLMVKDPGTINLIEVGENIKQKYLTNSSLCSVQFLFKAIDIANTTDLSYKAAQNKRLLIELALLKISNINKNLGTITETQNQPEKHPITKVEEKPTQYLTGSTTTKENTTQAQTSTNTKAGKESLSQGKIGISLKNKLQQKASEEQIVKEEEKKTYGKDLITPDKVESAWVKYAEYESENPRLKAFLNNHVPKQKEGNTYFVVVENNAIKEKLESFRQRTLDFMRTELNNEDFDIEYNVGKASPKVDYKTPTEKFHELLKEKPEIVKLKENLDLDLE